jgi:hypothetical protein
MATIGASAPSQNTINYDSLLSTTLMAYKPVMYDNIFKANAFMAAMRQYGGVDTQNGGERIRRLLMYAGNDTFKTYKGYDVLIVKPQNGITSAFYEWVEIGGTISISRREERQNSGEAQIMNLLKQKINQAEMSIKEQVNTRLIVGEVNGTAPAGTFVPYKEPINDEYSLNPLGYFLPKANASDPTVGGNVGNISRATYDWWRPHTAVLDSATKDTGNSFAVAVTTYKGLKVALYRMYNFCTRGAGGEAPNLGVVDQVTFETYENALDQQKQYMDESLATMGFTNVKLKGMTMVWDENVPSIDTGYLAGAATGYSGSAFFLNTKYYQLIIDSETDFVTTPFVDAQDQTAKVAKVLFMGNATVTNMRKLGVCYAIDQTIAA